MLESYARTSKFSRPRPLISAIGGWGSKCHMFTVLNMKSEKKLKIHVGVDDKQQIQFAPPNETKDELPYVYSTVSSSTGIFFYYSTFPVPDEINIECKGQCRAIKPVTLDILSAVLKLQNVYTQTYGMFTHQPKC